ncbi:hypothetical protein CRG98_023136 [Punica granatum]|uniref:Uncharacterized protein n=1 Tax=Punica granatum TaxID=22663 RepID=A0A2I0JJQ6_PUNGR|nr:hypothetical protein CRG98_023136 [Punica granatum]
MRDGIVKVGLDRWWVGFGLFFVKQTRTSATNLIGTLGRSDWHPVKSKPVRFDSTGFLAGSPQFWTPKGPSLVLVVVVWSHICRVDPYSPAKITENRVRLENRPDWAVFGSDVTPVSPDGILRQSQWFPTPN